jgi:hypothetical protein
LGVLRVQADIGENGNEGKHSQAVSGKDIFSPS